MLPLRRALPGWSPRIQHRAIHAAAGRCERRARDRPFCCGLPPYAPEESRQSSTVLDLLQAIIHAFETFLNADNAAAGVAKGNHAAIKLQGALIIYARVL